MSQCPPGTGVRAMGTRSITSSNSTTARSWRSKVKANERVTGNDLKGFRKLRESLGDRLPAGVALSTGLRSYTYEDRLHIMPVDRLWTTVGG